MKLIGRDEQGNPMWKPDDWEEPIIDEQEEDKEIKSKKKHLKK